MAKRTSSGIALSSLTEALQTLPLREALEAPDRRSIGRGRDILESLSGYRASEIARSLEISTQKYVALRGKIQRGEAGSIILNDLLDEARGKITAVPEFRREEFIAEVAHKGRRTQKTDVYFVPETWLRKHVRSAERVKHFASKRSAMNWYGGVNNDSAKRFFVIVPRGKRGWDIFDIRTPTERANRKQAGAHKKLEATRPHGHKTRARRTRRK